jgi:hypothetical protein
MSVGTFPTSGELLSNLLTQNRVRRLISRVGDAGSTQAGLFLRTVRRKRLHCCGAVGLQEGLGTRTAVCIAG